MGSAYWTISQTSDITPWSTWRWIDGHMVTPQRRIGTHNIEPLGAVSWVIPTGSALYMYGGRTAMSHALSNHQFTDWQCPYGSILLVIARTVVSGTMAKKVKKIVIIESIPYPNVSGKAWNDIMEGYLTNNSGFLCDPGPAYNRQDLLQFLNRAHKPSKFNSAVHWL